MKRPPEPLWIAGKIEKWLPCYAPYNPTTAKCNEKFAPRQGLLLSGMQSCTGLPQFSPPTTYLWVRGVTRGSRDCKTVGQLSVLKRSGGMFWTVRGAKRRFPRRYAAATYPMASLKNYWRSQQSAGLSSTCKSAHPSWRPGPLFGLRKSEGQ